MNLKKSFIKIRIGFSDKDNYSGRKANNTIFFTRVSIFVFLMQMGKHILYLLLGSNLGEKKKQMDEVMDLIPEMIGPVTKQSSFYETEPWGFSSEEFFLNRALQILTYLSPEEVIQKIDQIEKTFGRERSGSCYSSRTMDIDILFYDDLVLDHDTLKIPHPRMQDRRFVLVPLDEIAHELIHPVFRKTIGELLRDCTDTGDVRKFK
jgi:2-amino-4-hydroxy-6-hydroxymethyldihydropteridine diphosphokinase